MSMRPVPLPRALTALLVLPGVAAFLIPWLLRPADAQFELRALPILTVGAALLLWCVRDFYVVGQGTLAPWDPPQQLVVVGLYRYSRNPMYLAVLLILVGWSVAFQSARLWAYTAALALAFHLRVVLAEEPFLARTHGEEWKAYKSGVPRWLGPAGPLGRA